MPSLILNIRFDISQTVFTDRSNKIAVAPKQRFPIVRFQKSVTILFTGKSACLGFDDIYQFTNTGKRICFKQNMDMIRFTIHFQNDKSLFITNRLNGLIHQIFYRPKKDRLPVFCHQNQMVLQQKATVSVGVIWMIFLRLYMIIPLKSCTSI